jgi:hypothetical protein
VAETYDVVGLSEEEIRTHMKKHHAPHPKVPNQVLHRALQIVENGELNDRDLDILAYVAQMVRVGYDDTADYFFSGPKTAASSLRRLAHRGFLYPRNLPYAPRGKGQRNTNSGPRVAYTLTPLAKKVLNLTTPNSDVIKMKTIRSAEDIGTSDARHDLMLNRIISRLWLDAQERPTRTLITAAGLRTLELTAYRDNCLGTHLLYLGYNRPSYSTWTNGERQGLNEPHNLIPDGLMSLGITEPGQFSLSLPYFIECDTGSYDNIEEICTKLFDYWEMSNAAISPARLRFPEFNLPGLQPPVLWATQERIIEKVKGSQAARAAGLRLPGPQPYTQEERNESRVQRLAVAINKRKANTKWEDTTPAKETLPPIFIVSIPELQKRGFNTPVLQAHLGTTNRVSLLQALLMAYQPFFSELTLPADGLVQLKMGLGKAFYNADRKAATKAQERVRQEAYEKRNQETQDLRAKQAAFEEQRQAMLGGVA